MTLVYSDKNFDFKYAVRKVGVDMDDPEVMAVLGGLMNFKDALDAHPNHPLRRFFDLKTTDPHAKGVMQSLLDASRGDNMEQFIDDGKIPEVFYAKYIEPHWKGLGGTGSTAPKVPPAAPAQTPPSSVPAIIPVNVPSTTAPKTGGKNKKKSKGKGTYVYRGFVGSSPADHDLGEDGIYTRPHDIPNDKTMGVKALKLIQRFVPQALLTSFTKAANKAYPDDWSGNIWVPIYGKARRVAHTRPKKVSKKKLRALIDKLPGSDDGPSQTSQTTTSTASVSSTSSVPTAHSSSSETPEELTQEEYDKYENPDQTTKGEDDDDEIYEGSVSDSTGY